jgi:hypothetical protein
MARFLLVLLPLGPCVKQSGIMRRADRQGPDLHARRRGRMRFDVPSTGCQDSDSGVGAVAIRGIAGAACLPRPLRPPSGCEAALGTPRQALAHVMARLHKDRLMAGKNTKLVPRALSHVPYSELFVRFIKSRLALSRLLLD